ncbi:MAG: ThiF family adenylyltransferase [Methylophilaceae bacterium]
MDDLGSDRLPDTVLEGIAALKTYLGASGSALLQEVAPRSGELATFIYRLAPDYLGVERALHIGFKVNFPATGLNLTLSPDPGLDWPHALYGSLCLYGVGQAPSYGDSVRVVNETMYRFGKLFNLVIAGSNPVTRNEEFAKEITNYWESQLEVVKHQQLILLDEPSESCPLFVLSDTRHRLGFGEQYHWFATEKSTLGKHLSRLSGIAEKIKNPAQAAFYVRLTTIPDVRVPDPVEIAQWIEPHVSNNVKNQLDSWLNESSLHSIRWVFLQLPGQITTVHAFVLKSPGLKKDAQNVYSRRSGKNPTHIGKSAKIARLQYARVHVISRAAIHSRNPSFSSGDLNSKKVLMVGLGSLGSKVTMELIKEGVEDITLVDPDILVDANLGRHVLGADELGRHKAVALQEHVKKDMPLVKVKSWANRIQDMVTFHSDFFETFDVIVITTADAWSEKYLWSLKTQGSNWALVQAWSEPYALVGHCISLDKDSVINASQLFDDRGNFKHRFTDFPDGGVIPLDGCGAGYIPGGPMGLTRIASMVSSSAIDLLINPKQDPKWRYTISNIDKAAVFGGKYHGPSMPLGANACEYSAAWPSEN